MTLKIILLLIIAALILIAAKLSAITSQNLATLMSLRGQYSRRMKEYAKEQRKILAELERRLEDE